jgi:uncharacterized protein YdhG (YjbR/CyaY superfamily)
VSGPTSVEEYMAAIPPDHREALEKLRRQIKAAAPEAKETISYQMPAFRDYDRLLVSYASFKDHCSLFPMSTKVIADNAEELAPYATGKGTLQFTVEDPLPPAIVKKIVEARLAENAERRRR